MSLTSKGNVCKLSKILILMLRPRSHGTHKLSFVAPTHNFCCLVFTLKALFCRSKPALIFHYWPWLQHFEFPSLKPSLVSLCVYLSRTLIQDTDNYNEKSTLKKEFDTYTYTHNLKKRPTSEPCNRHLACGNSFCIMHRFILKCLNLKGSQNLRFSRFLYNWRENKAFMFLTNVQLMPLLVRCWLDDK